MVCLSVTLFISRMMSKHEFVKVGQSVESRGEQKGVNPGRVV